MKMINNIAMYTLTSSVVKKEIKTETIETEQQVKEEKTTKTLETKNLPAQDVLAYMANQAMCMRVDFKPTINTKNFVDTNQYNRISEIMKDFEKQFEEGMRTIDEEFLGKKLSQKAKQKIVLNSFDNMI